MSKCQQCCFYFSDTTCPPCRSVSPWRFVSMPATIPKMLLLCFYDTTCPSLVSASPRLFVSMPASIPTMLLIFLWGDLSFISISKSASICLNASIHTNNAASHQVTISWNAITRILKPLFVNRVLQLFIPLKKTYMASLSPLFLLKFWFRFFNWIFLVYWLQLYTFKRLFLLLYSFLKLKQSPTII